jgi:chromosome segregation ATPase
MDKYTSRLIELRTKTEKVLQQLSLLKSENAALKNQNKQLAVNLEEEKKTVEELNNKIKMLKLAKSIASEEQVSEAGKEKNTELKRKINEYIKEVDKCIALLNE